MSISSELAIVSPGPDSGSGEPHYRSLELISTARRALAECKTVDDVVDIRVQAEALRVYAKQAKESLVVQNAAAEIKLRAERKAGELLAQMNLNGGDRKSESQAARVKLAQLGISKDQSSRWQFESRLPDDDFEKYVEHCRDEAIPLTSSKLVELAKEYLCGSDDETVVCKTVDILAECATTDEVTHEAGVDGEEYPPRCNIVDANGDRVYLTLESVFKVRSEFGSVDQSIRRLCRDAVKSLKPGVGGTRFDSLAFEEAMKRAADIVAGGAPYAICPFYNGIGECVAIKNIKCKTCGGRGWVTKSQYEEATR